jgi:hypothetical protein
MTNATKISLGRLGSQSSQRLHNLCALSGLCGEIFPEMEAKLNSGQIS